MSRYFSTNIANEYEQVSQDKHDNMANNQTSDSVALHIYEEDGTCNCPRCSVSLSRYIMQRLQKINASAAECMDQMKKPERKPTSQDTFIMHRLNAIMRYVDRKTQMLGEQQD